MTNTKLPAGYYERQLLSNTRDAKRAPEIAARLRTGPLSLEDLIAWRQESRGQHVNPATGAAYAAASVIHDLGRLAGIGGPVEYRRGLFWLNESYREAVDTWARGTLPRAGAQE